MPRNMTFGLILIVMATLYFSTGCAEKPKGQPPKTSTDPESEKQTQMPWRVSNWVGRITNGPDGEPGKRIGGTKSAVKFYNDPQMTPELKAQLVAAIKKMIESEPMSNADPEVKEKVIAEGRKALEELGIPAAEIPNPALPKDAAKEPAKGAAAEPAKETPKEAPADAPQEAPKDAK